MKLLNSSLPDVTVPLFWNTVSSIWFKTHIQNKKVDECPSSLQYVAELVPVFWGWGDWGAQLWTVVLQRYIELLFLSKKEEKDMKEASRRGDEHPNREITEVLRGGGGGGREQKCGKINDCERKKKKRDKLSE